MGLFLFLGGIALTYGITMWMNPGLFIFLEPLRAVFLYVLARRY
jgi:hypothetical protein